MRKLTLLPVAILIICLLSGCASLISLIFSALQVGALVAQVGNLFGRSSTEFNMFLDGYDMGIHPDPDGRLNLDGLPTGRHVLTLASSDGRIGFHTNVTIVANQSLPLGSITPIQAGRISGQVKRQVGSSQVPLAGVRVTAIFGGGDVIKATTGAPVTLPPPDATLVIMGFTDDQGNYRLGPAQFGSWIVTCAYPAHFADAVLATVASGNDADNINLLLKPDTAAPGPATVQGTASKQGDGALAKALVAADLDVPFAPNVDPARVTALQSQVGSALIAQPWFRWVSLAAQTSTAGAYTLVVPPGAHSVYGFKYGYQAVATALTLGSGEVQDADFSLQPR